MSVRKTGQAERSFLTRQMICAASSSTRAWWKGRKRGLWRSEGSETETVCQRTTTTLALKSRGRRDPEHFVCARPLTA